MVFNTLYHTTMIYFPDQHMILTNSSKSIVPDESMSICKREYQNKEKILSNLINLTFEKAMKPLFILIYKTRVAL